MNHISLGVWVIFGCLCGITGTKNDVEEMYFWREVQYENLPYNNDVYIGKYKYNIPANNALMGLGYHTQSGLMIATVGRFRPGVPSNLNAFCVGNNYRGKSPKLWGFPNYERNTLRDSFYRIDGMDIRNALGSSRMYSSGYFKHFYNRRRLSSWEGSDKYSILNVNHPCVDNQCNRLFALDTGILYYGATESYSVQDPALLVYYLPVNGCKTRHFPLIRRVVLPRYLWENQVGFVFITLDYQPKGTCEDVLLYIAHTFDYRIIVYDYKRGTFWFIEDESMKPIISQSNMIFRKNLQYDFPLGIMNIALGWPDKNGYKNAYFAAGASTGEYVISTKNLKNPKSVTNFYSSEEAFLFGYRSCDSQTFQQIFDPLTGVIFFGEMQSKKIRCWNTRKPLNPDTVGVVYESDLLDFVTEIFVDNGYLWALSAPVPIIFLTDLSLDIKQINSRVFRINIKDAIKGTVCDTFGEI